ncbi:hypothetical protein NPIL_603891 [Nephila pilipes]|uniref:Uncharacterized protein n=1 Tax=Nephila pilipes TaxID=299642 RepID=A0A8X6NIC9_NEPPI|nr:hypothetical protein NPIL_603891 [Nephila pilipes]
MSKTHFTSQSPPNVIPQPANPPNTAHANDHLKNSDLFGTSQIGKLEINSNLSSILQPKFLFSALFPHSSPNEASWQKWLFEF